MKILLLALAIIAAPIAYADSAVESEMIPTTWLTNSVTYTFPQTNNFFFLTNNNVITSYEGVWTLNSSVVSNKPAALYKGRGFVVKTILKSAGEQGVTNKVGVAFHIGNDRTNFASTTIVTNTIAWSGTNDYYSFSQYAPTVADNVSWIRVQAIYPLGTNEFRASVGLSVTP